MFSKKVNASLGQVKRILQWLMRVFFSCTIGFEVPINNLSAAVVWKTAAVFLFTILCKMGAGLLANPFTKREVLKIGLSMVSERSSQVKSIQELTFTHIYSRR